MNGDFLHLFSTNLNLSGIVLSPEQKVSLEVSLKVTKNEYKFHEIIYWGRIQTLSLPYYIVQGVESEDRYLNRRTLFSQDCITWGLLNSPTEKELSDVKKFKGMLTGEIGFKYGEDEDDEEPKTESLIEEDDEEESESEESDTSYLKMKEENRLAALVEWIDQDTKVVPRGAYLQTINQYVRQNPMFTGLSFPGSGKLYNYRHFRHPKRLLEKAILVRAQLDKSIDFLDPISEDVPRTLNWSLNYDKGGAIVTVKSLRWPGYIFYHIPSTSFFGGLYYGNGVKNMDLPFMI